MLHLIDSPDDPRLGPYTELRDRHLRRDHNLFVAESEFVVRRLLASACLVRSVLATAGRAEALAALRPDVDVFSASPSLMQAVIGFPFHRGVVALGERPGATAWPTPFRRALVIEDLTDVDNLGALLREQHGLRLIAATR